MPNKDSLDYVIREHASPLDLDAAAWNALLAQQSHPSPFLRHEYLAAMHSAGSASPETGWTPRFITLWKGDELQAACSLYLKDHSYGEFVFDHSWANAYQQHGLPYYPKALIAPPFTPVPGSRLLARDAESRHILLKAVIAWCEKENLSSLHLLFCSDEDVETCKAEKLMLRYTVQFHWTNRTQTVRPPIPSVRPEPVEGFSQPSLAQASTSSARTDIFHGYNDFDDFLSTLAQDKRKKIRAERRKVAEAGVTFRWSLGADISDADWDFFYRCYERTYWEHGNAPYLSRDFFKQMQTTMPENWLLFTAEREGTPIATSLVAVQALNTRSTDINTPKIAYGRYWGALERVDCLHFEACYYQPIAWCINHGYHRFEGGAQGEHKMARALLPIKATSAHWLAHPAFAEAVQRFLDREGQGIENYMEDLGRRSPLKAGI